MGPMLFLKPGGIQFPPEKKVIKAKEYLVFMEAEKVIEKALEEAQRIVDEARKAYEAEKKKGYQAGLLEGKMTISQQMIDTVTSTVSYLASVEEKVSDIVIAALRKIIGEMDDKELVLKVVKNALALVRNEKQVTLRVSPKQVQTVKESLNQILADFPTIHFIDVMGDGRLKEGGCILSTEIGVVDASVEVQLEAIRRSLSKKLKGSK